MKRLLFFLILGAIPCWIFAQQPAEGLKATLKIENIHIDLNGQKVEWNKNFEFTLSDRVLLEVIIFDQEGVKYGTQFTYKKGRNRLKLIHRGYVTQTGKETRFGKKKKDMQVMRTSIPGSLSQRVVENIVMSKETLQAINVSYTYELIYK